MNQLNPAEFAAPPLDEVEGAIRAATDAILAQQKPDGHWVYELEADATIPAEYVLLVHYLAETPNLELERKIGVYLRRIQGAHGGWPLYHEGAFDISATVKAWRGRATKSASAAAPSRPMSSPAFCWRCMARPAGQMSRPYRRN
jgi:hypothetical protein